MMTRTDIPLALLEFIDFLAFDPDQPRDERGRFSNLGSSDASAASGRAKKSGRAADHTKAAKAHEDAASNHEAEGKRRRELAKKAKTKKDRARHEAAAQKHEDAAAHHKDTASEHHEKAGKKTEVKKKEPTEDGAHGHSLERLGIPHELSPKTLRSVEAAVKQGGFETYLAKQPLSYVVEHKADEERKANGVYWRAREQGPDAPKPNLSIKDAEGFEQMHALVERNRAKHGGKAEIGDPYLHSVSSIASTAAEMQTRTTVHELGHHLHLNNRDPLKNDTHAAIVLAYDKRVETRPIPGEHDSEKLTRKGAFVVSNYARENYKEWFAETHAAYVLHGEDLRAKDPEAWQLMRKVRKERGLQD